MPRRYDAFLIRHWSLDAGLERTEITHIQSGTTVRAQSLAQMVEWIRALLAAPDHDDSQDSGVPPRGPPVARGGDTPAPSKRGLTDHQE